MKQTAIITGASSGIGQKIALELANTCSHIAIIGKKNSAGLQYTAKQLEAAGVQVYQALGDCGDYAFVHQEIASIHEEFGQIDVLINSAGISHIGLFHEMAPNQWNDIVSSNLSSVFNTCHAVLPHMLHRHQGKILNISSVWGQVGASCEVAYSATKGGINSLTKALAKEVAPSHICVNALACGVIDTPMNHCFTSEELDALCQEIPLGRMGTTTEVAVMVKKILEAPEYLTGQIITFDGGWI